jgi:hypothetical protein
MQGSMLLQSQACIRAASDALGPGSTRYRYVFAEARAVPSGVQFVECILQVDMRLEPGSAEGYEKSGESVIMQYAVVYDVHIIVHLINPSNKS